MAEILILFRPEIQAIFTDEEKLDVLAVSRVGRVVPSLRAIWSKLNEFDSFELCHCLVFLDLILVHSKVFIIIEECLSFVLFCCSPA